VPTGDIGIFLGPVEANDKLHLRGLVGMAVERERAMWSVGSRVSYTPGILFIIIISKFFSSFL